MNARTLLFTAGRHGRIARERKRWVDPGLPIRRTLSWLSIRYQRNRQHETLARLNDRLLDDVGLQRDDVMPVVREPFWRL